jgi:hypothetical protein
MVFFFEKKIMSKFSLKNNSLFCSMSKKFNLSLKTPTKEIVLKNIH